MSNPAPHFARVGRWLLVALAASLMLVLAACSTAVLHSALVSKTSDRACEGGKAAYYLPKRLLEIRLTGGKLTVAYANLQAATVQGGPSIVKAAADRRYGPFCMGYSGSIFAIDKVTVDVDPETSLLKAITFNAEDKTVDVAIDLINALGELAAIIQAERAATENPPTLKDAGPFYVDPFDISTMEQINHTLADAGYCVFLDAQGDAFVPASSNAMCKETGYPQAHQQLTGLQAVNDGIDLRKFESGGVLYRPLLSHKMVVMRLDGRKWEVAESRYFELPNASPALLLHIDRAWIGDSQAKIAFDNGVPYDISVSKQSELNAVIEIPGAAIRAILNVPFNARAYRKAKYENQIALIRANTLLLDNLTKFEQTLDADAAERAGITTAPGVTASASPRLDVSMDECLNNQFVRTLVSPEITCAAIIANKL